jgi:MFS transporter, CP family, cyanate transporter
MRGFRPTDLNAELRALAALWLCGICLRLTVLAIPPVIPLMHQSFTLSQSAVGALTSLPVLLFSFAAIPGSLLVSRFGAAHVLTAGILVTALASGLRGLADGLPMLFAMTFAMGVGIAVMQPALPAVVRDWAPRKVALGTALYANALLVGEAISASFTIPWVLPMVGGSWRASLWVWAAPVFAIGVLAAFMTARRSSARAASPASRRWWPDWHDPLTWQLGFLMGFASSLYFATNAFLPDYLAARGRPDLLAASLSSLNWIQIPASIVMLLFAERIMRRREPFVILASIALSGLAGLLFLPDAWIVACCGVLGFANAFMLILTLALPPLISAPQDVSRLSAATLAIGYLSAFLVPLAGGLLWDATRIAEMAFAPLAAFAIAAIAIGTRLRVPRPHAFAV